jgi:pilus assembly protein CpaB
VPQFRRPRFPLHTARRAAAVLLAVVALVLAARPDPPPSTQHAADAAVAVAATDLPPGTVLAGPVRAGEPVTDVRLVGAGLTALLPDGQVAAPVRLADLAVAALVRAGDRVDVLATTPDSGTAEVVAASALVLAVPGEGADDRDTAVGLLLLAVDGATAARLAASATTATLTLSLPPP